jgi:predicted amidohydrolase
LLVLPELWDVGYFAFERYEDSATALDEGAVADIGQIAADRRCIIVAGSVLERRGGRMFNTVAANGRDGDVMDLHRKIHLFPIGSRERELLTAGDRIVVVPTPLGRIGLATCFDLRFPAQFEAMRDEAVDLFCLVSAWPAGRVEHWRILTRARAIETQTRGSRATASATAEASSWRVSRWSSALKASSWSLQIGSPGWVFANLDLDDTRAWRREFRLRHDLEDANTLAGSQS